MEKKSTVDKGKDSETLVLEYLKNKGYSFVQKNFIAGKKGELDLVMKKDNMLVFCEIKSLSFYSPFSIYETLSRKKKYRIKKSIDFWLFRNNKQATDWRFDLLLLVKGGKTKFSIEHYEYVNLYE